VTTTSQRFLSGVVFFAAGALFCALGYWNLKRDWNLVDEVIDAGDVLVVKQGPSEIRIAFSDIQTVDE